MYNDEHEKSLLHTPSVHISYNENMRRAHIAFVTKPNLDVRLDLRSHNWRWNPYDKVWQRSLADPETQKETERFIQTWYQKEYEASQKNAQAALDVTPLKDAVQYALEHTAVPLQTVPFTEKNSDRLFEFGIIQTPLERVKMGEHQFEKLKLTGRENLLFAAYQTLKTPDLVINEEKIQDGAVKKSHNYIKSFISDTKGNDGAYVIQDIVVAIADENVSISAHRRDVNNVVNKITKPDSLIYLSEKARLVIDQRVQNELGIINPTRELQFTLNKEYRTEDILSITDFAEPEKSPEVHVAGKPEKSAEIHEAHTPETAASQVVHAENQSLLDSYLKTLPPLLQTRANRVLSAQYRNRETMAEYIEKRVRADNGTFHFVEKKEQGKLSQATERTISRAFDTFNPNVTKEILQNQGLWIETEETTAFLSNMREYRTQAQKAITEAARPVKSSYVYYQTPEEQRKDGIDTKDIVSNSFITVHKTEFDYAQYVKNTLGLTAPHPAVYTEGFLESKAAQRSDDTADLYLSDSPEALLARWKKAEQEADYTELLKVYDTQHIKDARGMVYLLERDYAGYEKAFNVRTAQTIETDTPNTREHTGDAESPYTFASLEALCKAHGQALRPHPDWRTEYSLSETLFDWAKAEMHKDYAAMLYTVELLQETNMHEYADFLLRRDYTAYCRQLKADNMILESGEAFEKSFETTMLAERIMKKLHTEETHDARTDRQSPVPAGVQNDDRALHTETGNTITGGSESGTHAGERDGHTRMDGTGALSEPDASAAQTQRDSDIPLTAELPEGTQDNDGRSGAGLGNQDVPQDAPADKRSEHQVSTRTAGGRPLDTGVVTKKEIRSIREQCKALLERKSSNFTAEERSLLARYEGAGGTGEADASTHGTLYEFYTPKAIIERMWGVVDSYLAQDSRTPLRVLEPAAGSGRFLDGRPESNEFTVYELDALSAQINQILHPDAHVYNEPYQKQFFDEGGRRHTGKGREAHFDVVIGNPPYGAYIDEWKGKGEGKLHSRYEEYFIERGLDALKDGGILAFIVPSSFLAGSADAQKEAIASKGTLLEAWRLPEKAFPTTQIATDIIFLQKRAGDALSLSDNSYFKTHPDHVLGVMQTRRGRYNKTEWFVSLPEGNTLSDMLEKITADPRIVEALASSHEEHVSAQPVPAYTAVEKKREPRANDSHTVPAASTAGTQTAAEPPAQKNTEAAAPAAQTLLSYKAFAEKYGRTYSEAEHALWKRVSRDGTIKASADLTAEERALLASDAYIAVDSERYMHRALYLSGNIYTRLDALEQNTSLPEDVKEKNTAALLSVLPEPQPFSQIAFSPKSELAKEFEVRIGTHTVNLQEGFINWATDYLVKEEDEYGSRFYLDYTTSPINREDIPANINWYDIVCYIDGVSVRTERAYSDENKRARKIEAEHKREARRDTANALFNRYLQTGLPEADKVRLCEAWNRKLNAYRAPDYAQLPVFLDGMSAYKGDEPFTLYEQQIKGVSFLCSKGNGLLAYDVGVGKTAAGIAATVNQIQMGRASRPLIIVPKAVYDKWCEDFRSLFPAVKLNQLGNFGSRYLEPFKDSENPYGLIIPAQSVSVCTIEALQRISFTDESISEVLYDSFYELLGTQERGSKRERELDAQRIAERIGEASQTKDDYVFWEHTGFDHVTVDEAHRFKNLYSIPRNPERGKADEYKGLGSGTPSSRALKLFAVTQLVQARNEDRNVFLLTATPFNNSPLEVYSMLSFVARKELQERHIYNLHSFLNEFTEMRNEWTVTPKGDIEAKLVMKNFRQLGALQSLLQQYIDKVGAEEAGVIRPEKVVHIEKLSMTDLQKQIVEAESARMDNPDWIKCGGVLVSMNNMRQAMLSPALLQDYDISGIEIPAPSEIVASSPKLRFTLDTVAACYKKEPAGGQVIYMPRGVKEYPYLVDYLVTQGVPRTAIACIDASTSEAKRETITEAFNDKTNTVKILIGSETISEGMDLNGNSFALYNLMLGWNPTEPVQVEGRIWRQGNEQGTVHIVYPLLNDSIDSLIYQKHDEKASRIDALWSYKGDTLNVEDIKPEELKFDLIKDPEKKARFVITQKQTELKKDAFIERQKITAVEELIEARAQLQRYTARGIKLNAKEEKELKKYERKLGQLGLPDDEAIASYLKEHRTRLETCEKKMQGIEESLPELRAQFEKELQKEKDILPSLEEASNELSRAIVTNLTPAKVRTRTQESSEKAEPEKAAAVSEKEAPPQKPEPEAPPKARAAEIQKPLFDAHQQGLLFDESALLPPRPLPKARTVQKNLQRTAADSLHTPTAPAVIKLKENTAKNFIENVVRLASAQNYTKVKAYQELFAGLQKTEQKKAIALMKKLTGDNPKNIRAVIESWNEHTYTQTKAKTCGQER